MNEDINFGVECEVKDGWRHFTLSLSRANIDHLLNGFPEVDCLYGRWEDVEFYIFQGVNSGLPDRFSDHHAGGYQIEIDPFLGRDANRTSEQVEEDLVGAINASDYVPMIMNNKLKCGFARIRVV
jgi:hypothetical protein